MITKIKEVKFIFTKTKKVLCIFKNGVIDSPNEIQYTIGLLAYENNCNVEDIEVKIKSIYISNIGGMK